MNNSDLFGYRAKLRPVNYGIVVALLSEGRDTEAV